ncbi:MAG: alpha amylase C-terminal domain-containing protein [Lachnospiraceae bacterium]|nr:alpha amylase C-terminal domain-containing protein [Lachnospiraceae bacterium]
MNKRLYKLMDWAFIEEVIYSECSHPQDLLGPHAKGQTTLLQAYFPGSDSVVVRWKDRGEPGKPCETKMEVADDDGFYAQLLPTKDAGAYTYVVTYEERLEDGKTLKKKVLRCGDPYRHKDVIRQADIDKFLEGTCENADEMLGAHVMTLDEEDGTLFAVYAPAAMRVSVVGDFNSWDGRTHQMCRRGDSGIYELFVPGVSAGEKYQFEIKFRNYEIHRSADPFAAQVSADNEFISAVPGSSAVRTARLSAGKKAPSDLPLSIFQADPYSFVNEEVSAFVCMKEQLVPLCAECGYTHVSVGNILSSSRKSSDKIISYFATDTRLGTSDEFAQFVNAMHEHGIGVVLDWVPSYFASEEGGLSRFDGTGLFEHIDPRQGYAEDIDACLFNYSSNVVCNFLLSSVTELVKKYGLDGIRVYGTARMLYLDYSKNEWVPNIYGGNENIDAVNFIKKFSEKIRKKFPSLMLIAEDSSLHRGITDPVSDDGLGFDLKWDEVFYDDYLSFICFDPLYRGRNLHLIPDSMSYAFVENFILPFAGREKTARIGDFSDMLTGDEESRIAQLKLSLGYLFMHPGKKLIGFDHHAGITRLIGALNELYKKEPALHVNESSPECFEWLSNMNSDQSCISFVRKTDDPEDMLVVVINFSGIEQDFRTGVPYEGKYKEIFVTDDKAYGGASSVSRTVRKATDKRLDGRTQSISVKIRPQSMIVMKFIPYTEEELEKVIEQRIRSYTPIKKSKK